VYLRTPQSRKVRASVPIIPRTVNVTYPGYVSNDISVFPDALLENAVTGPITYQGEKMRGSPTYANNSANAIVRVAIPAEERAYRRRRSNVR
jgi:hypothetical protein